MINKTPGFLSEDIFNYLDKFDTPTDDLLLAIESFALLNKIPILSRQSAKLLEFLVSVQSPDRVLEIGTAIAYSAIRIARTLPEDSKLDTIEISKNNYSLASDFVKRAGLQDKINIVLGNALELLTTWKNTYDLIFIDADKRDYPLHYHNAKKILNPGGVILIDNLLWKGKVTRDSQEVEKEKSIAILKQFNEDFIKDREVQSLILPVGDGLGLALKKES